MTLGQSKIHGAATTTQVSVLAELRIDIRGRAPTRQKTGRDLGTRRITCGRKEGEVNSLIIRRMTQITGVLDGIQTTGCIYTLTVKPLGTLSGVWIMAVSTGKLSYRMFTIKVIASGGVIRIVIHDRIFIPDGRGYGMCTLNPSGFIMAKKADDLLAGMLLRILKPVGPQEFGVVHLMGIVAGGTLDRIIHPPGLTIIPAHRDNPRWV